MTTNTNTSTNPYYNTLFESFTDYISANYSLSSTSLDTADGVENDTLSKFTPGGVSNSAFINIAGNYKYSCIVPKEAGMPPNYIGVLKENNALTGFMDELFSFTDGTKRINCTRAAEHLYTKAHRTGDTSADPQAYCINFTDGMPYKLYEPALREVHMDIAKQLNSIIDYAISTGQTNSTLAYDDVLVSNFLNIFFTTDGKPRYYALRTGILPSAIAYARYLQATVKNSSVTFDKHYGDFEMEIDSLTKGSHFIPIGRSPQFLNSKAENERLFWYPFSSKTPYSYKYVTSANLKDKEHYEVVKGFNHYKLTNDNAQAQSLTTVLNSVSIQTDAINATLAGNNKTVLSYESCLSDIPAPDRILVLDSYNTMVNTKINGKIELCHKGNLTQSITNIDKWANVKNAENKYTMHPLLNFSGYNNKYLHVTAEQYGPHITEYSGFISNNSSTEELFYYNTGFSFQEEAKLLNRMNFYSSREGDKSVDPYALEFGVVSHDLYTIQNNDNKLTLNDKLHIKPTTFGVLGKTPGTANDKNTTEYAWHTVTCGITSAITNVKEDLLNKDNLLFSVKGIGGANDVPTIDMNITTIHYDGPYGGDSDPHENHGCNFWRDDSWWGGYDCKPVYYVETGQDYHEGRYVKKLPDKDFDEGKTVSVKFDTSTAVLGKYNSQVVYNLSNMTMTSSTMQGYYYTVHILAEDGKVSSEVMINPANGMLDYGDDDGDNLTKKDRVSRYGTGLQYFFGGNCDKSIFDSYYNKGLTLFQLLDPRTDAYDDGDGKKYGRVVNGLKYANRAFEWDYNVLLKAWHLALWIMNGYTTNSEDRANYNKMNLSALYTTNDAGLALSAFFDYIYSDSSIRLILGPSLKQINNAVGPYGSNSSNDGTGTSNDNPLVTAYGKKGAENDDNYDNKTLRGASWNVINSNRANRKIYDGLYGHAKAAATVFVNRDTALYIGSPKTIGNNGVGRKYWSKGDVSNTKYKNKDKTSEWGEHNADARLLANYSDGYLHLDHYSWGWNADNNINANTFDIGLSNNHRWLGVFMLHANKAVNGEYNAPFNWHMGPFHEVSPEAKKHTNEYGVRNELSEWTQRNDDGSCKTGISDNMTKWKQAWDGINKYTWDNQNPNIRIRLPMLWRYLKSLREKEKIYTDGQLMPCGIELHYCNYKKALMTSITDTEYTLPITTGYITPENGKQLTTEVSDKNEKVTLDNIASWQAALRSPSSVTFAEVLYDTYAITKNTITTWYTLMKTPAYYNLLIKDILNTVNEHSDKLTAMHRTKRYIDSISNKLGTTGKTLYNIPILPNISLFGATETNKEGIDNSIVISADMGMSYIVPPDIDLNAAKVKNVAIGVTYPPTLPKGQTANQFTAISSGIYANMTNFDGDTIGWIVPIPTEANLALLNAYDGSWRNNKSSVIALTMNNIHKLLNELDDAKLHWIGWVKSDILPCLSANDLNGLIQICYNANSPSSLNGSDVAVVPMVSLKITPYYNKETDCNTDGAKCTQSVNAQKECSEVKPFSVKFEVDTRGTDDSLKLIMIKDKIEDNVSYSIYNISNKVPIGKHAMTTYMTTVSYDKDRINIPSVLRPL